MPRQLIECIGTSLVAYHPSVVGDAQEATCRERVFDGEPVGEVGGEAVPTEACHPVGDVVAELGAVGRHGRALAPGARGRTPVQGRPSPEIVQGASHVASAPVQLRVGHRAVAYEPGAVLAVARAVDVAARDELVGLHHVEMLAPPSVARGARERPVAP